MEGGVESVYNLIPQEYHQPKKPPRYQSKFRPAVKQELKDKHTDKFHTNRHAYHPKKQFGPPNVPLRGQDDFLKKSNKDLPSAKKFTYPDEYRRKPSVPKNTEKPLIGVETKKDFVKTNAIENIMSVAKRPTPKYVDSRKGTKNLVEPSGLVPKYRNRKDYGQVPEYINQRKEEVKQAQKEYDDYIRERMKQGAMQEISESEREEMITGLKKNWETLQNEFLSLSVVIDNITKKHRKERIETELKQLERDIDLLERHKTIYISHY